MNWENGFGGSILNTTARANNFVTNGKAFLVVVVTRENGLGGSILNTTA